MYQQYELPIHWFHINNLLIKIVQINWYLLLIKRDKFIGKQFISICFFIQII